MEIDGSKNGGNGEDDTQIDDNTLYNMPDIQENDDDKGNN